MAMTPIAFVRDLPIGAKIWAAFLGAVAVICGLTASTHHELSHIHDGITAVNDDMAILSSANTVARLILGWHVDTRHASGPNPEEAETIAGIRQELTTLTRAIAKRPQVTAAADKLHELSIAFEENADATTKAGSDAPDVRARIAARAEDMAAAAANIAALVREDNDKLSTDVANGIAATKRVYLIGSLLGSLATCLLAWAVTRGVIAPTRAITKVLRSLAEGERNVTIPAANRHDELGELARSAAAFSASLSRADRLDAERQDVEVRAKGDRKRTLSGLADDFEKALGGTVESVSSTARDLERSARSLAQSVGTTQSRAGAVASTSSQMSANVHSVAAATEELSSTVKDISRRVHDSSIIANAAVEQAERVDVRIQDLAAAANSIGNVVQLIASVASQTNLLALNATIEAARAGEAGRGFAVVAQEVKALAEQTAKATAEIETQIGAIQSVTHEAVVDIKGIRTTIGNISEISTSIAAAVEQQGAATQEIACNITQAASGTNEVADSIDAVSKVVTDAGHASGQFLASAETLAQQSERLKQQVTALLQSVRAA